MSPTLWTKCLLCAFLFRMDKEESAFARNSALVSQVGQITLWLFIVARDPLLPKLREYLTSCWIYTTHLAQQRINPVFSKTNWSPLSPVQKLSKYQVLLGVFDCSCPLPLCPTACLKDQIPGFSVLVQLAAIHILPPHEAIVLAMQICMGSKPQMQKALRLEAASCYPQVSIASLPKHLPNRLVNSILQWLMAQVSQVLTLIDNLGLTKLKKLLHSSGNN